MPLKNPPQLVALISGELVTTKEQVTTDNIFPKHIFDSSGGSIHFSWQNSIFKKWL